MNSIEKDFLTLVRNCLHGTNEKIENSFYELEHLALTHICVPFVYRGALCAGISVPDKWKKYVTVSIFRNQKNMQIQDSILKTLEDAKIPCAIIKGSTVSVNYPEPMARTLGDIDVLVNEKDYEKAIVLLCGDKYEDESSENHKFHYKYTIQGVAVEIHKSVTEYTDDEYGKKIKEFMSGALTKTVTKQIDEFSFPSLINEYQAATLLLHTQRHFFENRLPIRMLCDWAMFVQSVSIDEWNSVVYPFISKMGLGSISDALTAVCNTYLGTECADKIKESVDGKTAEILMEEFLNCGVIKDEASWSKGMAASYSQKRSKSRGKMISLLMILNDIARHDFALARKSALFLPICWMIIAIRYIARRITGKRSKISFDAFNATAERKEYLIKELNLKD